MDRTSPVLPHKRQLLQAGSHARVQWLSRDADLHAVGLESLRWRYDNLTDGVVLQDWQDVDSPEHRGAITIPASLNAMTRDCRARQLNQVTFEMTDTAGNQTTQLAYIWLAATVGG